jgi:hypothetical protein
MNKLFLQAAAITALAVTPGISKAVESVSVRVGTTLYVYHCPNSCVPNGNGAYMDSVDRRIRVTIYRNNTEVT